MDPVAKYVAVNTKTGVLAHEATFYKDLAAVERERHGLALGQVALFAQGLECHGLCSRKMGIRSGWLASGRSKQRHHAAQRLGLALAVGLQGFAQLRARGGVKLRAKRMGKGRLR